MAKVPTKVKFYTSDVINFVADEMGVSKKEAKAFMEAFIQFFYKNMSKPYHKKNYPSLQLKDFGTFKIHFKAARKNFKLPDGSVVNLPAKTIIKFKPASKLSDAV